MAACSSSGRPWHRRPADIEVLKAARRRRHVRVPACATQPPTRPGPLRACVSRTTFKGHSLDINGASPDRSASSARTTPSPDGDPHGAPLTHPIAPGYDIRDKRFGAADPERGTPDGRGCGLRSRAGRRADHLEVQCLGYSDRAQQVLLRAYARAPRDVRRRHAHQARHPARLRGRLRRTRRRLLHDPRPALPRPGRRRPSAACSGEQNLSDEERLGHLLPALRALVSRHHDSPITRRRVPSRRAEPDPHADPDVNDRADAAITARSLRATRGGQ